MAPYSMDLRTSSRSWCRHSGLVMSSLFNARTISNETRIPLIAYRVVWMGPCSLFARGYGTSSRILFDSFEPIASRIIPGEQRIVVVSAKGTPDVAHPEDGAFVVTIVRDNPIIFAERRAGERPQ